MQSINNNNNQIFTSDDGVATNTSREQRSVESKVLHVLAQADPSAGLAREKHVAFLMKGFEGLSQGYESLDASKPWLCYWISHALDLLDSFPMHYSERIADYLAKCQDPAGGFCGGPGQLPHLAPTYAAVNALVICGGDSSSDSTYAYKVIDREKLYKFLLRMKCSDVGGVGEGGFTMHEGGEVDVRGTYCALSVAKMLNILTPALTAGSAEYVARCQTYEGGIGGYPGNEAHGGYTFCGFAAMILMEKVNLLNVPLMLSWVSQRQMKLEGGFQGRTNKLVDSCYSFWQGALFPLIQTYLRTNDGNGNGDDKAGGAGGARSTQWLLFDTSGLQRYILSACQDPDGGLKDKPGKGRDYYHTCYSLSGLAVSQRSDDGDVRNLLKTTHAVHNICVERVAKVINYFKQVDSPS